MSQVSLNGQLVCRSHDEAAVVFRNLPLHISLTRAEPGCVWFEVRQIDALLWRVEEQFVDEAAFAAHQARVAASEWGRVTAGIERRYETEGITSTES